MKDTTSIFQPSQNSLQSLPKAAQLLLVGMWFVLARVLELGSGVRGRAASFGGGASQCALSRETRRQHARYSARTPYPLSRDINSLRTFLPRGLTETQYLERCTRLSVMGRFQIYNFLYYRWEFWRRGAVQVLGRMPRGAASVNLSPCGLCAAHLGPD